MAEFDIEKVERILWSEGFDYKISGVTEDGDAFLEVFGVDGHVAVDGLYPVGSEDWLFLPEVMYVAISEPSPYDNFYAGEPVGIDHVEDEQGLFEAIRDALGGDR